VNVDEAINSAERLADESENPRHSPDSTAAIALMSQAFSLVALAKIARGDS